MKINLYLSKNYHQIKGWSKTYTIIEEGSKSILFQASTRGPVVEIITSIKQFNGYNKQITELCRELSLYSYRNSQIKLEWDKHILPIITK